MSLIAVALAGLALAQEPVPAPTDHAVQDASPALVDTTPRIVREAYLTLEVADPAKDAAVMRKLAESVGGRVVSASTSLGQYNGDSASLTVEVPVEQWARVEAELDLGATGSLQSDTIARADQLGDGPPHVSLSIDYHQPEGRMPNFLVGALGGVSVPIDGSGLGVAQQVGIRAMGADREGLFEAVYAPGNGPYSIGENEPWMVKLTAGSSVYSEFMGNGERAFLNPYIGGQLGYAYRGESWFILQGELGLELLHVGHVIWDVGVRPTGAFRKGAVGLSVEGVTGLVIPF